MLTLLLNLLKFTRTQKIDFEKYTKAKEGGGKREFSSFDSVFIGLDMVMFRSVEGKSLRRFFGGSSDVKIDPDAWTSFYILEYDDKMKDPENKQEGKPRVFKYDKKTDFIRTDTGMLDIATGKNISDDFYCYVMKDAFLMIMSTKSEFEVSAVLYKPAFVSCHIIKRFVFEYKNKDKSGFIESSFYTLGIDGNPQLVCDYQRIPGTSSQKPIYEKILFQILAASFAIFLAYAFYLANPK